MSGCESFADAVIDDGAEKPAGLAAHLATCASCQALQHGHRGALGLQGSQLRRAERVPVARVVRRAAVALVALAVVAFALTRPTAEPAKIAITEPTRGIDVEQAPMQLEDPGPLLALAQLSHTVTRYARANPVAHGYGPRWKSLPLLVAPTESSFHPVVFIPEE